MTRSRQDPLQFRRNRTAGHGDTEQPSIELHIGELVLHGFSPGDRYAIGEAVEQELGRLLALHGMPGPGHEGFSVDRIDAGSFRFRPSSRQGDVGTQVAESVYRGLVR
jgi:hypothetical protein